MSGGFPNSAPTGRVPDRSTLAPSRCFVVSKRGAIVREDQSFGSKIVAELPTRCVVTAVAVAENPNGARVQITEPIAGWLSLKTIELYPRNAPEPETAHEEQEEEQEAVDDGDDDDSSTASEEESVPPPTGACASFAGYHAGYFYGTCDGVTGYHRDERGFDLYDRSPVPDGPDGGPGEAYKVVGLLGVLVRATPEIFSPVVGHLEHGEEIRVAETCEIVVADKPTPGDPWARAAHKAVDKRLVRARLSHPVRGWMTLSPRLVKHLDLTIVADRKRLRECVRRLERGGGVGDAAESHKALEELASLVSANAALLGSRDVRPYVPALRALLNNLGVASSSTIMEEESSSDEEEEDFEWQGNLASGGAASAAHNPSQRTRRRFVAKDAASCEAQAQKLIEDSPADAPGSGVVGSFGLSGVFSAVWSPREAWRVGFVGSRRGLAWRSPETEACMRWMMQKLSLNQDMLLASPVGLNPRARSVVDQLCASLGREVEWLCVTRDTTAADLRQRREIVDGDLRWVDAAPVRAACKGRILVIQGLHHAERNVLVLLNDLLENRNMTLDDGTTLVSPGKYDEASDNSQLRRASAAFVVVALAVAGKGIDPPLRSRFSGYHLQPEGLQSSLARLVPVSPGSVATRVALFAEALLRLEQRSKLVVVSEAAQHSTVRLVATFKVTPREALKRAFPHDLLFKDDKETRRLVEDAIKASFGQEAVTTSEEENDSTCSVLAVEADGELELRFGGSSPIVVRTVGGGGLGQEEEEDVFGALTSSQRRVLCRMLEDHCTGVDVLVVGDRGVGKTRLASCFAKVLGYRTRTVHCHRDLQARELLQRRVTNEKGDTLWVDSPLIQAATQGDLALLESVDRLPPGLLASTLSRLLVERELELPDGSTLLSAERKAQHTGDGKLRVVHPAFRVVATATTKQHNATKDVPWLDSELAQLFHVERLEALSARDERLIVHAAAPTDAANVDLIAEALVAFNCAIRDHLRQPNASSSVDIGRCLLSPNQLRRATRAAAASGGDVDSAIERAVGAYARFLEPPAARDLVRRYADVACRKAGQRAANVADGELKAVAKRAGKEPPTPVYRDNGLLLVIGDVSCPVRFPEHSELVPWPHFVGIHSHQWALRDALLEFSLGHHLLLIGNQGVGKNKVADRLLELLHAEREYVQLHRDSTVSGLTSAPSVKGGVVRTGDSALVRALIFGRVLVVDEADKAPLEVVGLLKTLVEGADLCLGDARLATHRRKGCDDDDDEARVVRVHPGFRLVVLANRCGGPFVGNDFYAECGESLATIALDNAEVRSESQLLAFYAPSLPDPLLQQLSLCFADLRRLAASPQKAVPREARLDYPYSSRELVKVVQHLELFHDDGLPAALRNVFAFDAHHSAPLKVTLTDALKQWDLHTALDNNEEQENDDVAYELQVESDMVTVYSNKKEGAQAVAARRHHHKSCSLVPRATTIRGVPFAARPVEVQCLRWMLQKLALRQDMLLIGDPGGASRPRQLATWLCQVLGRECEFVSLTRDTTESELKQRRELVDGNLLWSDAPPVLAAVHGRVLILEGMERCERNVLPLLNNLLENREIELEDGGSVISAARYDALEGEKNPKLRRASEKFIVIAIGVAVPKHPGTAIDPPLRSRLCAYTLAPPSRRDLEQAAETLCSGGGGRLEALRVARFAHDLRRAWEPTRPRAVYELLDGGPKALPQWKVDDLMRQASVVARPWAPEGAVESCARLLAQFPGLPPIQVLRRAYPFDLFQALRRDKTAHAELDTLLRRHGLLDAKEQQHNTESIITFAPTPRLLLLLPDCPIDSSSDSRPPAEELVIEVVEQQPAAPESPLVVVNDREEAARAEEEEEEAAGFVVVEHETVGEATEETELDDVTDSDDDDDDSADEYDGDGLPLLRSGGATEAPALERVASDDDEEEFDADGRPILQRSSGGGGGKKPQDDDDDDDEDDASSSSSSSSCDSDEETSLDADGLEVNKKQENNGINTTAAAAAAAKTAKTVTKTTPFLQGRAEYVLESVEAAPNREDGAPQRALRFFRTTTTAAESPASSVNVLVKSGLAPPDEEARSSLSPTQRRVLTRMLQDHSADLDVCLVGERGCGKTTLVRDFAQILGYTTHTLFCYRDMGVRDLVARRVTDDRGNTVWRRSALVEAALTGGLAVLDGIDRLPPGVLYSALGRLFCDRELDLPDGTRLVAHDQEEDSSSSRAVLRVHPAFRIVCTAEMTKAAPPWLEGAQVAGLMHFEVLPALSSLEIVALARHHLRSSPRQLTQAEERSLVDYAEALRKAAATEPVLLPLVLNARRLGRLTRFIGSSLEGEGLAEALERSFAGYDDFLPSAKRRLARRILRDALQRHTPKRRRRAPHQRKKRGDHPPLVSQVGGRLQIGSASAPMLISNESVLVPRPHFVDVPEQLWLLEEMLGEWSRNEHLLLIGNQGVGKNKVADRLLELLGAEREYLQLHRDTTVESLTSRPTLVEGQLVWRDSELVRAATKGRVLLVDEADKASLEVVCVLKALLDDGDLLLADGRRLTRKHGDAQNSLQVHPNFRLVVLANRPGFPFTGNDFYAECGDAFSCFAVNNVDQRSETQMVRGVTPLLEPRLAAKLVHAFAELRRMHEENLISYPFSSRELIKVCEHLEAYPKGSLRSAFDDVFALDAHDPNLLTTLRSVIDDNSLQEAAAAAAADPTPPSAETPAAANGVAAEGTPNKTESSTTTKSTPSGDSGESSSSRSENDQDNIAPPKAAAASSTAAPSAAAGAAGSEEPKSAAQPLTTSSSSSSSMQQQQSEEGASSTQQQQQSEEGASPSSSSSKDPAALPSSEGECRRVTKKLGSEDRLRRLHLEQMTEKDEEQYSNLRKCVSREISELRSALEGREARARERSWVRLQSHGELDETRLVDGLTGATNVYKRRCADLSQAALSQRLPKRLLFLVDISGSMYTYNKLDGRLTRLLQCVLMLLEALEGFEDKYEYCILGHSGAASQIELVKWREPPKTRVQRLKLLRKMVKHAQTCKQGDHTLKATKRAIAEVTSAPADEYFVFLVSDADFGRYGLSSAELSDALLSESERVSAYALFLASNFAAADKITEELPPGLGFACYDTSRLAATLKDLFQASVLDSLRGLNNNAR